MAKPCGHSKSMLCKDQSAPSARHPPPPFGMLNAEFWILLPLERRSRSEPGRANWTLSSDGNIFPCVPRRSAALLVALVRVFGFGKYLIAFRYLCRGICEWMPLLPQRADWSISNAQYPIPNAQYPMPSAPDGWTAKERAGAVFGLAGSRKSRMGSRESRVWARPTPVLSVWSGLDWSGVEWNGLKWAWDPGEWRCGYCQVLQLNSPWAKRFTKEISNCYSHLETSMRASMNVWHSPDDDDDKFPARRLSGDCPAPTHHLAHGRRRGGLQLYHNSAELQLS